MKKIRFVTTLYTYDRTEQIIDPNQETTVVFSGHHPRGGTVVNTTLFIEALYAYIERRNYQLSTLKSLGFEVRKLNSNYINVDDVLDIYFDLLAHEFEKIESLIMEAFYG